MAQVNLFQGCKSDFFITAIPVRHRPSCLSSTILAHCIAYICVWTHANSSQFSIDFFFKKIKTLTILIGLIAIHLWFRP